MKFQYLIMMLLVYVLVFSGALSSAATKTGGILTSAHDSENFLIASVTDEKTECGAPVPTLLGAVPADRQITLTWSDEHNSNISVTGYNIYLERDGKSEPVTSVWPTTTHTLKGLVNGEEYCLKVTSLHTDCESVFSKTICAVPVALVPQK